VYNRRVALECKNSVQFVSKKKKRFYTGAAPNRSEFSNCFFGKRIFIVLRVVPPKIGKGSADSRADFALMDEISIFLKFNRVFAKTTISNRTEINILDDRDRALLIKSRLVFHSLKKKKKNLLNSVLYFIEILD